MFSGLIFVRHFIAISGVRYNDPVQDPLGGHTLLQQRRIDAFTARFPAFEVIFHETVNGDGSLLKAAVMHFILITKSLADQI